MPLILIFINHITQNIAIGVTPPSAAVNYLKQDEAIAGGKAALYVTDTLLKITTSSKLEPDKLWGIKGFEAKVENSFIADGCEIEGTVINSVLFRGVKVGKGTVVKNSILMQDTITGTNVSLNYVVTDKNVTIRDRNVLSGCEKIPYYLGKNTMV